MIILGGFFQRLALTVSLAVEPEAELADGFQINIGRITDFGKSKKPLKIKVVILDGFDTAAFFHFQIVQKVLFEFFELSGHRVIK